MSWGHDEYLYHAVKDRLPVEAHYMLRYHSFYAAHREGACGHLMNDRDREMFKWVRAFNRCDLYSKGDGKPDAEALKPYYQDLLAEYFPTRFDGKETGSQRRNGVSEPERRGKTRRPTPLVPRSHCYSVVSPFSPNLRWPGHRSLSLP